MGWGITFSCLVGIRIQLLKLGGLGLVRGISYEVIVIDECIGYDILNIIFRSFR
jgi:hypothetical protein